MIKLESNLFASFRHVHQHIGAECVNGNGNQTPVNLCTNHRVAQEAMHHLSLQWPAVPAEQRNSKEAASKGLAAWNQPLEDTVLQNILMPLDSNIPLPKLPKGSENAYPSCVRGLS